MDDHHIILPPGLEPLTALRLYPEPRVLAGDEAIHSDLELPSSSGGLPYAAVNMVSSVDGGTSVSGKASGIGGLADRLAMRALRSKVDAVMIGAGTLRAERINLGLDGPAPSQPLAVVVGGSGRLPVAEHLITDNQRVLVVLPEGRQAPVADPVEVLYAPRNPGRGQGRSRPEALDLPWVLTHLRAEYGVERLLIEGGPSLNQQLVFRDLGHEVFLTVSPILVASGTASILVANPDFLRKDLHLVSVHVAQDRLFLRYRLRATA